MENGVKFPRDVQQLCSIYYISQSFLYLHERVTSLVFFFSVLAFVPHPLFSIQQEFYRIIKEEIPLYMKCLDKDRNNNKCIIWVEGSFPAVMRHLRPLWDMSPQAYLEEGMLFPILYDARIQVWWVNLCVVCIFWYKKNRKKVDVRPSAISTFSHSRNEWATARPPCMTILLEKERSRSKQQGFWG